MPRSRQELTAGNTVLLMETETSTCTYDALTSVEQTTLQRKQLVAMRNCKQRQ